MVVAVSKYNSLCVLARSCCCGMIHVAARLLPPQPGTAFRTQHTDVHHTFSVLRLSAAGPLLNHATSSCQMTLHYCNIFELLNPSFESYVGHKTSVF